MADTPGGWGVTDDRPSPRDASRIADVLDALQARLRAASAGPAGAPASAGEEAEGTIPPEVAGLIAAAVAELSRLSPSGFERRGVAPVLGTGVMQGLLRHWRDPRNAVLAEAGASHIDERR